DNLERQRRYLRELSVSATGVAGALASTTSNLRSGEPCRKVVPSGRNLSLMKASSQLHRLPSEPRVGSLCLTPWKRGAVRRVLINPMVSQSLTSSVEEPKERAPPHVEASAE